ncbi:MAG: ribulose-phosphate 3-epimerase [Clostridiales bacterium]|nr:ribulose-phosphate 3-epimerase [Clostridiales bacterium]
MLISPSILASDFSDLANELQSIEKAGADMVHIDVMDGMFVPNFTLGAPVIKCLRSKTKLPFDVHLMIEEPVRYVSDFAHAGADIITFHYEAASDTDGTISEIVKAGCKPAISIKPSTPADVIYKYLDKLYMVLVMTVEPGFGGQSFMEDMMPKVKALRAKADEVNPDLHIQVDGGIDGNTVKIAAENGADVFVAGSYIFKSKDRKTAVQTLRAHFN